MRLVMLGGGILAAAVLIFAATVVAGNRALGDDEATPHRGRPARRWITTTATGSQTMKGQSFAGVAPANAAELAKAHEPFPATLPPVTAGDVVKVQMTLKDVTIEIAPGVEYNAWGFDGRRARGRSSTRARARRSR